jgi:hypothetical protein
MHQARAAIHGAASAVDRWLRASPEDRRRWAEQRAAEERARDEFFANARRTTWDGRPLLPPREGERYWRMPEGGLACPLHGRGISQDYACDECRAEDARRHPFAAVQP